MAFGKISMPNGTSMQGKGFKFELKWDSKFPDRMNNTLDKRQKIIDSEVLRLSGPMVPLRTGTLERSGTIHTVIGSGEVKWSTPYARRQYYATATSRSYDANRGGMWFERMKTKHKAAILKMVEG